MSTYTREQVRNLVDGKLDWDTTLRMLSMPKDGERFKLYLAALQEKLGWSDRIVLPLGPHLHIVQQPKTSRCDGARLRPRVLRLAGELEDARAHLRARGRDGDERGLPEADGARHQVAGLPRVLLPAVRRDARRGGADALVPGDPRLRAGHRRVLPGVGEAALPERAN